MGETGYMREVANRLDCGRSGRAGQVPIAGSGAVAWIYRWREEKWTRCHIVNEVGMRAGSSRVYWFSKPADELELFMPGIVPRPTPILRFLHVDNLPVILNRCGLHAPNHCPDDGLVYKTIHNTDIQRQRSVKPVSVGPRGVIHDYVAFYFGPLSPMLLNLKTGRVAGYTEGQEPLVYLVSSAQAVHAAGLGFVFTDGHGIAAFTGWFDDLNHLDNVDWNTVGQRYWTDNANDNDRMRRKQAEFLAYRGCAWTLIDEIVVMTTEMQERVLNTLANFPQNLSRPVRVAREWYYW